MAKMAFRLPPAASVIENPSPEEAKELTARMPNARPTQFGNINVADGGRLALEALDLHRHRRPRRPEPVDDAARTA